jgi:predicted RNA-binding Zn-ribbon protein involved in translation (DUF1610 family)
MNFCKSCGVELDSKKGDGYFRCNPCIVELNKDKKNSYNRKLSRKSSKKCPICGKDICDKSAMCARCTSEHRRQKAVDRYQAKVKGISLDDARDSDYLTHDERIAKINQACDKLLGKLKVQSANYFRSAAVELGATGRKKIVNGAFI